MNKRMIFGIVLSCFLVIGIIILAVNMPGKNSNDDSKNVVVDINNNKDDKTMEETVFASVDEMNNNTPGTADESTNPSPSPQASPAVSEDEIIDDKVVPTVAESGTPVANHGELSVDGTQLVDKNGKAYQIKGVSTHGIQWFPEYVNEDTFRTLRDEWGVNCIRLAMYTAENGYCEGGNKTTIKNTVTNGVDYATNLGMYVIIDWHILHDLDPNVHKDDAIAFFDEMSKKYASNDNVIYEICNEPNGGTSWSQIKSYAEEVIPVIKANNPDAIIIVGTPTWSQDVDQAAADPIKGYTNIMYTVHFYADTHKDDLRNKMNQALAKGLPIFCTEFGICDASGNGACNIDEANKWIDAMNAGGVSYCIWNLSNKNESSSLISSSCTKKSGWTESELSEEGKWYVGVLSGKATGTTAKTGNNSNNNNSNNGNASNNNSGASSSASNGSLTATIKESNSWQSGNDYFYQYAITLKADGGDVSNWQVQVAIGTSFSIDNSWNGTFEVSGNNLIVKCDGNNAKISSGQTVEPGLIIKCSKAVSGVPAITVK